MYISKAMSLYTEAFDHFSQINHLKGMYLSKKHQENLLKNLANNGQTGEHFVKERSDEAAQLA